MKVELSGGGRGGVDHNPAHADLLAGLKHPLKGISQQRTANALALNGAAHSQTCQHDHRDRIGHVAPKAAGGGGHHKGACCPAALIAQGTALEPVVEADVAAIKVAGGMVSGEGLGEAMVLWRRELGLGGASSRRRNASYGSEATLHQTCSTSSSWAATRAACSTKSVRVRPEALTARSIKS